MLITLAEALVRSARIVRRETDILNSCSWCFGGYDEGKLRNKNRAVPFPRKSLMSVSSGSGGYVSDRSAAGRSGEAGLATTSQTELSFRTYLENQQQAFDVHKSMIGRRV